MSIALTRSISLIQILGLSGKCNSLQCPKLDHADPMKAATLPQWATATHGWPKWDTARHSGSGRDTAALVVPLKLAEARWDLVLSQPGCSKLIRFEYPVLSFHSISSWKNLALNFYRPFSLLRASKYGPIARDIWHSIWHQRYSILDIFVCLDNTHLATYGKYLDQI